MSRRAGSNRRYRAYPHVFAGNSHLQTSKSCTADRESPVFVRTQQLPRVDVQKPLQYLLHELQCTRQIVSAKSSRGSPEK